MRRFILLLLLAPYLCSGYQVYIDSTDLEEYFSGTSHFSYVQGRRAVIFQNGTSQINANGSLYLVSSNGTKEELLPPLPKSVDSITITWLANSSEVVYSLSVDQDPSNFFASQHIISINDTGVIPVLKDVFVLNVTCGGVMGEGDLMLTLTVDNSMQLLTLITKDCGSLPSSSLSSAISPTLSPTSAGLTSAASSAVTAIYSVSLVLSSVSSESMTAAIQTQTAGLSSVLGFDSSSTGATTAVSSSVIFTPTPSNLPVTSSSQLFSSDLVSIPAPTNSQASLTSSLTFSPAQTNAPSLTISIHASSPPVTVMSSSPGMLISSSQSSEIVSRTMQSSSYYSTELVYTTSAIPTKVLTSTAIPTEVLTSTPVPTEVLTSTAIPTEVLTSTPVPTEVLTSTAVPTEVLTSTPVPTEVLTSTPVPTEVLTSTPVPTEVLTSTPVPTEVLKSTPVTEVLTSTPVPTEVLTSTAVPTEVLTSTPVPTEVLTSTAIPTEVLTSTPVPTEVLTSTAIPTEVLTSTPVPTEVLTSTSTAVPTEVLTSTGIPTEVLTSTPVPTEVLTSTPVLTEVLTSTPVPTEVLTSTSTAVPTEVLTSTGIPTEVLTSTPVPTEVLTSTPVPTEVLTSTPVPTEVLTSTPVPTEVLTSTAIPTEVLTSTPVPTEVLTSTSTAVPTEVLTSTGIPTEVLTSTAVPTEVLTSTPVPTEVLTSTPVPTEVLTSTPVPTEVLTSTAIPTEVLTSTAIPTEVLTSTPVPTEVLTSTPVPTEVLTSTPVPTELLTSTAIPTEVLTSTPVVLTSTPVPTEVLTSTPVPTEVLTSTPVPTEVLTSTPVPTEVLTSTAIPTEFVTSTPIPTQVLTPIPTFVSSPVTTMSSLLHVSTILSASTTATQPSLESSMAASTNSPVVSSSVSSMSVSSSMVVSTTALPSVVSSFILESSLSLSPSISSFVATTPLLSLSTSAPSTMSTFTNVPMSHSLSLSSSSSASTPISEFVHSTTSFSSSGVPVPSLSMSTLASPSVTMSSPLSVSSLLRSLSPSQTSRPPKSSISDFVMSSLSSLIVSTSSLLMSSSMLSPSSTVSFLSSSSGSTSQPTGTDLTPVPSTIQLTTSRHPLSTNSLLPGASSEPNVNGTGIPAKEPELMTVLLIAFAPVVAILLVCIILICCCICCIRRRKRKNKHSFNDDPADLPVSIADSNFVLGAGEFEASTKTEAPISLWTSLPWGVVSTLPKVVQGAIHPYTVDRRALSILSTIYRGMYGCIVNGQLSVDRTDLVDGHKGVMMKMLIGFQQNTGHHQEIAKFLECATIMRDLDHPNVSKVMNVSVEDNLAPLVLYPIVEYGNLHTFLTFCRVSPNESPLNPVTLQYKVNFGLQVAYAMKYLSDKGVVHPDLALRNCLLDTNYLVKVSDGALSQEFFPNCYYIIKGAVRPVRWAAPETIAEGLCTSQSNVWSYAVTLWEIMTKAEFPYREVDNNRSIPSHLMMGARLEQPPDCPNYLYELMQTCWDNKAEQRPNFGYLHSRIEQINEQLAMVQDDSPLSTRVDQRLYSRENSQASLEYPSSRRKRSGRSSLPKNSPSITRRSRVSAAGSEHLSLTFSVLSGDLSSESSSEEEGPEMLSPLAESVVYQMIPSLLKDDPEDDVKHLPTSSPMNLVNSFLDSSNKNSIELETSPTCIPSTFISPAPTTPSTVTTRLTHWETNSYTSSQFAPSTVRSDDSANSQHVTSSPSPDLTSKSSMFGEDTNSNPRFSYISHSNADTVSKASISESVGASTPGLDDCPQPSPIQKSNVHTHSNGHPNMNGAVSNHSLERTAKVADSSEVKTDDINGYEHSDTKSSVKPPTAGDRTSFSLGLTDLSSDFMSTFDSWNL